jgi:hypothetical protein
VSLVFVVITISIIGYNARTALEPIKGHVDPARLFRDPDPGKPVTRKIEVPARSRDECLKETDGVANDDYVRCRNGYTITVTETK